MSKAGRPRALTAIEEQALSDLLDLRRFMRAQTKRFELVSLAEKFDLPLGTIKEYASRYSEQRRPV